MRLRPSIVLVALLLSTLRVGATPITTTSGVPGADSYVWYNGQTKAFELSWDGTHAFFQLEGVGEAVYNSLDDCCTDTFDRVRTLYPSASLLFTGLTINTMPVNTVFVDNLNLSMLKNGALDNLGVLAGLVTMTWDDPYSRMPVMSFIATAEGYQGGMPEQITGVPEPATLLLLGSGLLGGALSARKRARSSVKSEI